MIQINIAMPDSCRECWFLKYDINTGETSCGINDMPLARYFQALSFEGLHEECPLIDVPDMNVGNSSEIPNCSTDCISRQAAIDALGEEPMVWIGSDYELAQKNQWNLDKLAIETVPSAQPEPCVDAVSRKDAIKDVCDALKVAFAIDEDLEEALDIITTTISTLPSVRPDTKFLDFLWNVINPNEMENYLSMYHSSEEKTDG